MPNSKHGYDLRKPFREVGDHSLISDDGFKAGVERSLNDRREFSFQRNFSLGAMVEHVVINGHFLKRFSNLIQIRILGRVDPAK